jgi:hypothetical protein
VPDEERWRRRSEGLFSGTIYPSYLSIRVREDTSDTDQREGEKEVEEMSHSFRRRDRRARHKVI